MEVFTLGWRVNCMFIFANLPGPPERSDGQGPPTLTAPTLSCAHTHAHSHALCLGADPAVLPSCESLSWPPPLRPCGKGTLNPSTCSSWTGPRPGTPTPHPFLSSHRLQGPCGALSRPSPGLQAANTVAPGTGFVQAPPGPSSPRTLGASVPRPACPCWPCPALPWPSSQSRT